MHIKSHHLGKVNLMIIYYISFALVLLHRNLLYLYLVVERLDIYCIFLFFSSHNILLLKPAGCTRVLDGCEPLLVDSQNEFLRCISRTPTNQEETRVRFILSWIIEKKIKKLYTASSWFIIPPRSGDHVQDTSTQTYSIKSITSDIGTHTLGPRSTQYI